MDESSNQSAPTTPPSNHQNNELIEEEHPNESINTTVSEDVTQMPQTSTILKRNGNQTTKSATKSGEHKPKSKIHPKSDHSKKDESLSYVVVQKMLSDEGAIQWDKNVSQQIQELMCQMTSQVLDHAKSTSEHRESSVIETEDVEEALNSLNKSIHLDRTDFEQRLNMAADRLNNEPLPKIRTEYGLHVPNERFMMVQPDYRSNEISQINFEPKPKIVQSTYRPAINVYSKAVIEQTFHNPSDPSEFD